jgi:predicted Zn finger-like uncharacterized protein
MYTQCPECHARFRVGASDLAAAGGTVRCGRCGGAFNALAWLSDTVPPSLGYSNEASEPGESGVRGSSSDEVPGIEFHFTADDIESVFIESRGWADRSGPAEQAIEATDQPAFVSEPPIVVENESRPFEDITLEGERISIESILGIETDEGKPAEDAGSTHEEDSTDEFEVLRDVPDSAYPEDDEVLAAASAGIVAGDAEAAAAAEKIEEQPAPDAAEKAEAQQAHAVAEEAEAQPAYAEATADTSEAGPAISATLDELLDVEPLPAATRGDALAAEPSLAEALAPERARLSGSSVAWSIGCLVIALALLAQITHQFRQDLVRHPQIGPLLRDIYARIGVPLSPNWDLSAFELRQWGNNGSPDPNGQLTVRASLTNRASFAQPHPILRLELDDRFGDSIAVRDFEPAEYLKNPSEASRLLGPGAGTEAELVIVEPGQDAVGYQLDVCLRESAAILRCAQGPG